MFLTRYFAGTGDRLALCINPVDYAVSGNDYIFELMKYDILTAMIGQFIGELELEEEEYYS
jgi:hypothetical protein